MREPKILIVGRVPAVIHILVDEAARSGRQVWGCAASDGPVDVVREREIDVVIMGAGLPDETRHALAADVAALPRPVDVRMIVRTADGGPAKLLAFLHEHAVAWKVAQVLGPRPTR